VRVSHGWASCVTVVSPSALNLCGFAHSSQGGAQSGAGGGASCDESADDDATAAAIPSGL
jgi:hypothetical protein